VPLSIIEQQTVNFRAGFNMVAKRKFCIPKTLLLILKAGRAIAQAVSLWLPTAAARVRDRSGHVGFVVDKVAL
jgi:hypothetical protein